MKTDLRFGAIAAAAVLCACSTKEAAKSDSTKVSQAGAVTAAPVSRGKFDPSARVMTVYAKDFSYELPDTITSGWTTIHLVNDGTQLHHMQLVRLDSGKTVQDLQAAFKNPGPPPTWASFVGGPNAPDPKNAIEATLNLEPGNYAVLCLVDLGDHVPHFAKGMIHPLTVTANAGAAGSEPKADANVSLSDYKFTMTGALTAGKHVVKVVNNGPQMHEVELVRFLEGKTMKDLAAWVNKPDGPPPAVAIGGVTAIHQGGSNYVAFDLVPGNYAMLCFLPDAKDNKPHIEHGMVKEFKIN